MKNLRRGALVILAAIVAPGFEPAAGADAVTCAEREFHTSVPAPTGARLAGTLCFQGSLGHKTLVVFLPGIVANRSYFDFPVDPARYSQSRKLAAAGYVTFTVDRMGTGASDRPPSVLVNLASNTDAAHALVTAFRAGQVGGVAFDRIVLAGHSFGALVGARLAVQHPGDVDALALIGATHEFNKALMPRVATGFYPAQLDPKFGPLTPPGYLANPPGVREEVLFEPGNYDASIAAADEALKDTVTVAELNDLGEGLDASTVDIAVPVFLGIGQRDRVFCGDAVDCSSAETLEQAEGPFFSPPACLTTFVLPAAGHYETLHLNAGELHRALLGWVGAVIPARSSEPLPAGCGRARGSLRAAREPAGP